MMTVFSLTGAHTTLLTMPEPTTEVLTYVQPTFSGLASHTNYAFLG